MGKGEQTRQAILDRAAELARTVGLEGLTIGRLADEMKLSKSGLFAHFGSKENLAVDVIRAEADRFVAEVVAPALKKPRGEPRLRALFAGWLEWGRKPGGCIFVALSAELDDRPGPARDVLVATLRDWVDTLATAAKIAIAEEHLGKKADPRQIAIELWGIMLANHQVRRLFGDEDADARAKKAFERVLADNR